MPDLVAVVSGKGGVGKTTVAVNLAFALLARGVRVGLVDGDLHGPDVPRMLGVTRRRDATSVTLWTNPRAAGGGRRPRPLEIDGLRVVSNQLLLGEEQAFDTAATFGGLLLRRFVEVVDWGDAQLLVVDLPPGTGDALQELAAIRPVGGAIVVVTPQDVAHLDARKVVTLLRNRGIPILGGVENMAGLRCPDCDARVELFPPTAPERTIWHQGVDQLVSIPFDPLLPRDAPAFGELASVVSAAMS